MYDYSDILIVYPEESRGIKLKKNIIEHLILLLSIMVLLKLVVVFYDIYRNLTRMSIEYLFYTLMFIVLVVFTVNL